MDLEDIDFEHLIGDRDVDICKLIGTISVYGAAQALFIYARGRFKERWPEAEPFIAVDSRVACLYARFVIKGRWPEAEPYIMKDPVWAPWYSNNILLAWVDDT